MASQIKIKPTRQKLLKTQRDISVSIIIVLFEHIRHPLQDDATLHKEIETHLPFATLVVRRVEQVDERGGKSVAEGNEGFGVFVERYVSALVLVESVEEGAPCGEEAPESAIRLLSFGYVGCRENRTYQNSSKLILPLLSTSNIRIIILTVCKSKLVKSPFTSAFPNSLSVNCPVPLLSTALKSGKSDALALLLVPPGAGVGGGRD
jgi:hypothetical protein